MGIVLQGHQVLDRDAVHGFQAAVDETAAVIIKAPIVVIGVALVCGMLIGGRYKTPARIAHLGDLITRDLTLPGIAGQGTILYKATLFLALDREFPVDF